MPIARHQVQQNQFGDSPLPRSVQTDCGSHSAPNEWLPDALSLGLKPKSREANLSLSSNAEEKKEGSYNSKFPHA
jgi:hypothetical protein